jgi:hypothetical protein
MKAKPPCQKESGQNLRYLMGRGNKVDVVGSSCLEINEGRCQRRCRHLSSMMQLAEGIVLAIAAIEIAAAQKDRSGTMCATHWRFLPPVQVRDEYSRPQRCTAITRFVAQTPGSAMPRAQVTVVETTIGDSDPGAKLVVREVQIGAIRIHDPGGLLTPCICRRHRRPGYMGVPLVFAHVRTSSAML